MDIDDVTQVIDNDAGAYGHVQMLAHDARDAAELGSAIRDYIREMVPEDQSITDLLWSQAFGGVSWRAVGDYYWEDFGDDSEGDDE